MFELALNCEGINIFLVNVESSKLLDNKYFWETKLQVNNLIKLVEKLSYKSYNKIVDSHQSADLIIAKNNKTNFTINIGGCKDHFCITKSNDKYKVIINFNPINFVCHDVINVKLMTEVKSLLVFHIYSNSSDDITDNRGKKYLETD